MENNVYKVVPAYIRQEQLILKGERVLVACSGGVDSMALLHFLSEQRSRLQIEVGAIHVDHCLRGEASAIDGRVVSDLCRKLRVPFYGRSLPVPDLLREQGGNVQDVCRSGRYALFKEVMRSEGFSALAAAHHAEDQLETVLMQLAKGQRPKGMPVRRKLGDGKLIRPFMEVSKEDLYEYAALHHLPFREDPSNEKEDYTRNRYRRRIVPELLRENPRTAENSVRVASALQVDDDFLEIAAKEQLNRVVMFDDTGVPVIHTDDFRSMHPALQKRVIPLLLRYVYNGEILSAIYNADLLDLLMSQLSDDRGSASISLPLGWKLRRDYHVSTFVKDEKELKDSRVLPFPPNEWVQWGSTRLYWCKAADADLDVLDTVSEWRYFQPAEGEYPSLIRSRRPGDRIRLSGMSYSKRLNRVMIDDKVKQPVRNRLPIIITEQGDVCAIPGIRYNASFSKKVPDTDAYILMMESE